MHEGWELAEAQMVALAGECRDAIALYANASALLHGMLADVNWTGFYLVQGEELILGPFQGKVACVRIEMGRGVCGTAFAEDRTQRVPDVHAFPGHIACDAASRSEIVIPVHGADGCVIAVLDIDSPVRDRFTAADQEGLESFVRTLERCLQGENVETEKRRD